ncbi:tRNA-uridine aminocarboxypropyltransferase 1 [Trichomycterus rosablanca]|uniref:tRNA-uridine aminocarboxypropyltransferase 1 n=1 Tax=Trichomycterus rosablanca TaxID=2290929 RepID=UPI002F35DA64
MPETESRADDGHHEPGSSEEPLQDLILSSHSVLEEAHRAGRMKCSRCGGSRVFYCYTCCCLVGLDPRHVPKIKLPVKIDIIKHPNETDGKSTAVHAKLIAPDHVSIYTYPCIPELDEHAENVVLVFPGPDAMTVDELGEYFTTKGRKREAVDRGSAHRRTKKPKLEDHRSEGSATTPHSPENPACSVQRVIFIDSTWNQTNKIITDERLQGLAQVELKSRRTCFWRHQRGSPDTYLATIEAIYYFLKDFHVQCLGRAYTGEYDNLLFFYCFLHRLINKAKQAQAKSA